MFEEGENLRKIHGSSNVFDFTLGNPCSNPPDSVQQSIIRLASQDSSTIHKYMNNAGFPDVRESIALDLSKKCDVSLDQNNIVMTVGAAGALNVILKTLLNPGEEVVILAPYFVEYLFYIDNHGGVPIIVNTVKETFQPDIFEIEKSITHKTRAIIINSPNNPTGVIYSEESLKSIATLLEKKEKEFNTSIYVISDEPYREIVYDKKIVPSVLSIFRNSFIAYSYSKSLSLAGERIGYIAVNPKIVDPKTIIAGLTFCNRTLGFVNAPSLFQKVIKDIQGEVIDIAEYKEKRDYLYGELKNIGYQCPIPEGAFYLFVKSLDKDDVSFVKKALKYNLLLVPGTGFGCSGYFRISYCVTMETIKNSISSFQKLFNVYEVI
jgi:aspartate aminotransferase